jgi:integrase
MSNARSRGHLILVLVPSFPPPEEISSPGQHASFPVADNMLHANDDRKNMEWIFASIKDPLPPDGVHRIVAKARPSNAPDGLYPFFATTCRHTSGDHRIVVVRKVRPGNNPDGLYPLFVVTPRYTLGRATAIRRNRGPALSRRRGQNGNVYQHCKPWNPAAPAYGRYWKDVPGAKRKREVVPLGVCSTLSTARRKLRDHIEKEGINTTQTFISSTAPGTPFRTQARSWILAVSTRRRKPVKPATIAGWQHSLNKWVLPNLGDLLLADVNNAALKELVEKMYSAGLSPQTIVTHVKVVKMVVASATNTNGEQIHPRKWNHDFVGLPIVDPTNQRRPTLTRAEVEKAIANSTRRYSVLFSLLAGTGLRIGEALGVKPTDLSPDCRVLQVRRSIWHGQEQQPKTPNAIRDVDIPESLSHLLRQYVNGKFGYLFAAASGRPLQQRNVLRVLHAKGKKGGFHAFRRFRTETLRRACVPEDLIRFWLGHSKSTVTDFYAGGLTKDLAWRREWCDRVGCGFQLGNSGLQPLMPFDAAKSE